MTEEVNDVRDLNSLLDCSPDLLTAYQKSVGQTNLGHSQTAEQGLEKPLVLVLCTLNHNETACWRHRDPRSEEVSGLESEAFNWDFFIGTDSLCDHPPQGT